MAEKLFVLGDIGATNLRVGIYNEEGQSLINFNTGTNPEDYEGTVQMIADTVEVQPEHGEIVAASIAVAAEVDESGVLTRSGGLTPWLDKNLGHDLEAATGLPEGMVGTPNDCVALALSQQHINAVNGRSVQGVATTLSSGWGGALYYETGKTKSDEPGHEYLRGAAEPRKAAICPCGEKGHAEAYISGNGVKLNHGMNMEDWLTSDTEAPSRLIKDIAVATTAMIERIEADSDDGFAVEELRWTGGVALGQPFVMARAADFIRSYFADSGRVIASDTLTMGEQAGLHGTFIDARSRAENY